MKVCFPVEIEQGMKSEVYGHFGSAPAFVIVETENNTVTTIRNNDQHHAHGACNPLKKFSNQQIDVLVVGGIGMGALNVLNQSGIKVFRAQALTVDENVALLKAGNLAEFTPQHTCAGHGHGGGCGH
ncbi:MAG: NifB/NifX family molybdenum-iron cluster-binding protein [Nitrospirota bacterium]